jgi:predicted DNA-binding protein YlxM (UPF0122 family)
MITPVRSKFTKAAPLAGVLSKADFLRLYVDEKRTVVQIAETYGVSQDAVFRLRRSYGIPPRRNSRNCRSGRGQFGKLEFSCSPAEMVLLYRAQSLSMEEIGLKFGVSRKAVQRYFKKHQIPAREKKAARRLAMQRNKIPQKKHKILSEYFRQWSPAMAWTMGVLFVRGLVTEDNKNGRKILTVMEKDVELLKLIKRNLGSSHPLIQHFGKQGGLVSHRFEVANVVLVEDLIRRGVSQNRNNRKLQMPVPPEYVSSFVRGVFEGGGDVSRMKFDGLESKSDRETLVLMIRHRSETILNQIRIMLAESEIQTAGFVIIERNTLLRSLEYYDDQCHKLLRFMYPNTPELCHWPTKRRETARLIEGGT